MRLLTELYKYYTMYISLDFVMYIIYVHLPMFLNPLHLQRLVVSVFLTLCASTAGLQ